MEDWHKQRRWTEIEPNDLVGDKPWQERTGFVPQSHVTSDFRYFTMGTQFCRRRTVENIGSDYAKMCFNDSSLGHRDYNNYGQNMFTPYSIGPTLLGPRRRP
jgi:hypothetical protein